MEYAAEALSDETSEITPNDLAGDYACIAEIIGIENTIFITHKHYRGQQIHTSSTSIFCSICRKRSGTAARHSFTL